MKYLLVFLFFVIVGILGRYAIFEIVSKQEERLWKNKIDQVTEEINKEYPGTIFVKGQ